MTQVATLLEQQTALRAVLAGRRYTVSTMLDTGRRSVRVEDGRGVVPLNADQQAAVLDALDALDLAELLLGHNPPPTSR